MPILVQEIRRLRPKNVSFRKTDSKGLYLEVFPNGSKLWRYKFRIAGREKRMALGAWPDISLADARKRRDVARLKVLDGIDPTLERKRKKRLARMNAGNSFKSVADDFIKVRMEDSGKAESTIRKARWYVSLLEPDIGRRPINDIEPVEVLESLKKIERRGHRESANRTRALASRVFRHGIACSLCKSDPAAHLGDALATPIVTHRAAILDPDKFGQLLRDIDEFTGTPLVRIAMQILPHIMTRPGEMRMGQWSEIDWGQRIWSIPAERTKLRRLHAVPLSDQVMLLLRELHCHTGGFEKMFPAQQSHLKHMSDNSINQAMRRMGYGPDVVTAHGFRSTASTFLNESGKWHPDAIERALAHGDSNAIRGIYNRGNYWDERVQMAQWWSDYLDELKAGAKVLPFLRTSDIGRKI